MVPHIKVEEQLHELGALTEQTFAVTGVPDERKGERLVVLYQNLDESAVQSIVEKLTAAICQIFGNRAAISFSKSRRCRTLAPASWT